VVLKDDSPGQASVAQGANKKQEAEQVANELSQKDKVKEITQTYGSALKGFAAKIPEDKVEEVRSDPRVEFVAEDREVQASAQTLPTGVDRVDADQSSAVAGDGSGATDADIAIIDTGIYSKHSDLNVAGGKAGGKDCARDHKSTFSDDNGHGTHVAGTAAAKDNSAGVVGTAPGACLWAVKVLDASGRGKTSWVVCGIDWVTKTANTIEVANMSLGGSGKDDGACGHTNEDPMHEAICNSVNAGVTYVVAAGNEGEDVKNHVPAAYNEVLTVTAIADYNGRPDEEARNTCKQDSAADDHFASFSNFADSSSPDKEHMIGAPGVCITSTWKGSKKKKKGTYKTISGTSMASPHAAGAAALYKSTHPTATPSEVKKFMLEPANSEAVGQGHTGNSGQHPEPVLQMDNY
jgi:subtilisin